MANDGLMSYFAKIGLDTSDFLGGIQKADSGILQFYRDVSVSMAATMMVFDKVMQYGQQFIDLANKASEYVETIDKLSVTTGMNADELERWSNVARYADSDIETLAFSVNRMQMVLSDTGAAGEEARKYLDAMGVSYRNADGSLRSSSDLFPDIIEGLNGLENSADRVTVANAIFGRSYQSLAGYMDLGKERMRDYFNTAAVMTEEHRQGLRDYEESVKDLNTSTGELAKTAGAELAPSMSEFAQLLNGLAGNTAIIEFFTWLNGAITLVSRGLYIMAEKFETVFILATKGVDAANKHSAELDDWVAKKSRDDALRAAGVKTDGMGNMVVEPDESSGRKLTPGKDTAEEDRLKSLTKATEDLTKAKQDLFEAENKLTGIKQEYYEDVLYAGRDMSQIASLTQKRDKAIRAQEGEIATAQGKVSEAGVNVAKYGDVVVNIDGKTVAKVPGVAAGAGGISAMDLMAENVRIK